MAYTQIFGTKYQYAEAIASKLQSLRSEIGALIGQGRLSSEVLRNSRQYFRVETVSKSKNVEAASEPLALAYVAHTWFVTIHPFIDGNGRTARLLLNLMLMRYGYHIAIIRSEDRLLYYDTLEAAQTGNLTPFMRLIVLAVKQILVEYLVATSEEAQ